MNNQARGCESRMEQSAHEVPMSHFFLSYLFFFSVLLLCAQGKGATNLPLTAGYRPPPRLRLGKSWISTSALFLCVCFHDNTLQIIHTWGLRCGVYACEGSVFTSALYEWSTLWILPWKLNGNFFTNNKAFIKKKKPLIKLIQKSSQTYNAERITTNTVAWRPSVSPSWSLGIVATVTDGPACWMQSVLAVN